MAEDEEPKKRMVVVESLGWLTESLIMPNKHRVTSSVEASSIMELKAQLYQSQEESKKLARRPISSVRISCAASNGDDIVTLMHGSNPVRVELNRLENDIRDKDRELGDAVAEIKSLRNSEHLKERAVKEDNKVVDEVVKEEMFGL
ncbi:hypothetical protein ACFX2B_011848 [Malus domestica]